MASAKALHNPDDGTSGKNHAIAPFRLVELIRYSGAPRHLRATLQAMLKAADNAGIVLWPAIKGIMIEGGVCRRTVQRNLKRLTDQELLIRIHPANQWLSEKHFRHTATYRLNVHKLRALRRPKEIHSSEWRTYREYKNATRGHRPQRSSPPAQAAAAPPVQPPPTAAPVHVASPQRDAHRDTRHPPRRLTPREGPQLVAKIIELMQGYTTHVEAVGGYGYDLRPDDPRYRPPMSQEHALTAACMTLGIPHDAALEHLKLCQWKFEEAEPSP